MDKNIKINIYYLKYNISKNNKYLKKIYDIMNLDSDAESNLNKQRVEQSGGFSEFEKELDLVIKNIDLIRNNVDLFNKLYKQIVINDNSIKNFNENFIGLKKNDNLENYINKINNEITIFVE